jgi:predicted ATPase
MWAGRRGKKGPESLKLGFAGDDFGYALDFGLPTDANTAFHLDPEIKSEAVWAGPALRPSTLLADRSGPAARLRDGDGGWCTTATTLRPFDSMLSELADPQAAPELLALRDRVRSWRFYDHVRTDATAPARIPQIGTRTTILSHDGADLAAALQTIVEIGDAAALAAAVDDAFPGSRVEIRTDDARFEVTLRQPGMLRALTAAELSDGTLRYLLWAAALLTPRPAELTVLNEPEASLHPDLLPALAGLITRASEGSQIVVVTHAGGLVTALRTRKRAVNTIELEKTAGETAIVGQGLLDEPSWHWPTRG